MRCFLVLWSVMEKMCIIICTNVSNVYRKIWHYFWSCMLLLMMSVLVPKWFCSVWNIYFTEEASSLFAWRKQNIDLFSHTTSNQFLTSWFSLWSLALPKPLLRATVMTVEISLLAVSAFCFFSARCFSLDNWSQVSEWVQGTVWGAWRHVQEDDVVVPGNGQIFCFWSEEIHNGRVFGRCEGFHGIISRQFYGSLFYDFLKSIIQLFVAFCCCLFATKTVDV